MRFKKKVRPADSTKRLARVGRPVGLFTSQHYKSLELVRQPIPLRFYSVIALTYSGYANVNHHALSRRNARYPRIQLIEFRELRKGFRSVVSFANFRWTTS